MINSRVEYPLWLGYADMSEFLSNPITMAKGRGVVLTDTNGKTYIDMVSGIRNVLLGYSQPKIVEAITQQLNSLAYARSNSFGNEPALELAKHLAKMSPVNEPRIFFHNSGSEAVEAAIKLVRQLAFLKQNRKSSIITLNKGYHGQTIMALSASGEEYSKEPFEPLGEGFVFIEVPQKVDDISQVERIIKEDSSIGAIMIEPILGNAGVITLPDGYLEELRKVCDAHNLLLICDEISTGFGRCGKWFLSDVCSPDILIVGKAITNGYLPLSAVIVSKKVWKEFDKNGSFRHGQTNLNHPVCCACGLATIELLEELNIPELCIKKGEMLKEVLRPLIDGGKIISMRGRGLMWALIFDSKTNDRHQSNKWLQTLMLEHGFIIGQIDNTIFVFPPVIISEFDILSFMRCLKRFLV